MGSWDKLAVAFSSAVVSAEAVLLAQDSPQRGVADLQHPQLAPTCGSVLSPELPAQPAPSWAGWDQTAALGACGASYWGCLAFGFDGRPCISEGLGCESNCSSPVRAFLWHSGHKGSVCGSVTQVFGVTDSHYVVWSLCEPQLGFLPHLAGSNLISSCTRSGQRSNAD